jgi:hypothetical protein
MAKALPWYREAIPKFIIHFEQEIKAEAAKGSTWLPWARYAEKMGSVTSSSLKPGEELPGHKELRDRAAEDAFWVIVYVSLVISLSNYGLVTLIIGN